ncbi:MAG: hypothetical protein CMD31_07335 [Flavobacteriales bacterium]|nr:hypothetical protein [Flavobacteriales bacterium]|tara:strand:+ start:3273 stop:7115 length:3843 start_codon:yes stop_codon:yes gene_type:complete
MNTINWLDFNGDKFQVFCNDLLSFEFGKSYIPFSAPGKDKGVDGLFEGEYDNKKGKWRFQAKFKNPETGRQININSIKNDIKSDLNKNVQDEDYIIFITNIDIGATQYKELKNIAKETNSNVVFDIWDAAKIHTVLTRHPIVRLWYVNELKHLILEYSEFFQNELNSNINTTYELSNKFYHRNDKIEELNKFINDDSKKVAIISGEAGIGKTRLCVEFFRQYIDCNDNWIALVIITHKIDLEDLKKALTGKRNYIVLIDDADKFDKKDIADLITILKGIKENKVKLVLTVRDYFLKELISQVTINDRTDLVKQIKLPHLTKEETIEFLNGELNVYRIVQYLEYFVELTHGVPIMIMTLLKVIKNRTPLAEIKKDSFLNEYIKQHFDDFSKTISKENEIQKRIVDKVIKIVALIEPIHFEDNKLIDLISSNEDIPSEDVEIILQNLKNQNIISGRYQFAIHPDMYSDLILEEEINKKNWLKNKLLGYGIYIDNIIKNIGYACQHDGDNLLLENLLKEYINQIDTCSNQNELVKILETVNTITYLKPSISANAVEKVINIYSNENHSLNKKIQQDLNHKNYSFDSVINNLKSILSNLFQLETYYQYSYSYSGKLYEILKDEGLVSNIAKFSRSDSFDDFNCKRQSWILSSSKAELKKKNGFKYFALKAIKAILKLEFTGTEPHILKKHSIQIYTINIPENKSVTKLRKDAIEFLIEIFNTETDNVIRAEVLKIIVKVPSEIFSTRNKSYKGTKEIDLVLNFLNSISSKNNILELKQKQQIKEQLYWLKKWGIDKSYNSIIDKINNNLSKDDLAEKLLDLFNPKYDGSIDDENQKFKSESQNLVESNSAIDLGVALIKVLEQSEYTPHYFYYFLDTISQDLIKTKEFINYLWETDKGFVMTYCPVLLKKIRFSKNEESYFWEYIENILNEENIEARNCILNIYNSFSISDVHLKLNNDKVLNKKDVEIILNVIKKSTIENYFYVASTLPTLFFYDKKIAIKEIKKFLTVCNERHLDSLFLSIEPFEEKFYPEIKELLLKHTISFNIPYRVESTLNKIIRKDGFKEVLDYIENRFLYKRNYIIRKKSLSGYDFVPTHTSNAILQGISEEEKIEIFKTVLDWFINLKFESYESFYAINVIELFSPKKYIDINLKELYIQLIDKYDSDYQKLLNIIKSLSEFKEKDENLIDLVIKILEVSFEKLNNEKQIKKITDQCYVSLTTFGVKTGTPGQPFAVDIQLKELLEKTLNSSKVSELRIRIFLQNVLKTVQSDIDRVKDEEGEELW